MSVALLCVAAVALDALLGEPSAGIRWWRSAILPGASSNVSIAVGVAGAAMA